MSQALIIRQAGKPQRLLEKYVRLLLNYRYGYAVETVDDFIAAGHHLRRDGDRIRCVFVIQDVGVSPSTIPALSADDTKPVFLVQPGNVAALQRDAAQRFATVHVCAWEEAFSRDGASLQKRVVTVIEESSEIDKAIGGQASGSAAEKDPMGRLMDRLDRLDTLPTLPAIVLRIMQLIRDPKTTTDQLEQALCRDPSIVLTLLKVINSPVFAGVAHKGRWTLKEAIVRLGLRKVGAIAQQVALINKLVGPDQTGFDLERFWRHSVACALVADRLCEQKSVDPGPGVEFSDYWIAALLHDAGKLVMGFFFYDWFERIARQMEREKCSFFEAEAEFGGVPHTDIGALLLRKAKAGNALTDAVALHHDPGDEPQPLESLIHLADNMAKEMGLAYGEREPVRYDRHVLSALKLKREDTRRLREGLEDEIREDVHTLVGHCLGG